MALGTHLQTRFLCLTQYAILTPAALGILGYAVFASSLLCSVAKPQRRHHGHASLYPPDHVAGKDWAPPSSFCRPSLFPFRRNDKRRVPENPPSLALRLTSVRVPRWSTAAASSRWASADWRRCLAPRGERLPRHRRARNGSDLDLLRHVFQVLFIAARQKDRLDSRSMGAMTFSLILEQYEC